MCNSDIDVPREYLYSQFLGFYGNLYFLITETQETY